MRNLFKTFFYLNKSDRYTLLAALFVAVTAAVCFFIADF